MRFILLITLTIMVFGDTIPKRAKPLLDTVYKEQKKFRPDIIFPSYVPALIEHESCLSLTHSKCWSPRSELKTKREHGVGLGQLTKAYNKKGKKRFDTLRSLARKYPKELGGLKWSTIKQRPDLQIRAILITLKEADDRLPLSINSWERMAMVDSAYNGGMGGLRRDRKLCGLRKNCDPTKWFRNVEKTCTKSKRVLYGRRNACDINRHHVRDVVRRIPKYEVERFKSERN